ncbi:MAG: hypothetical protein M5U09_28605 [Gammaproteobacteria bacterium]|nr:hypothetical protein [Gammaproteobacteria bacterium]
MTRAARHAATEPSTGTAPASESVQQGASPDLASLTSEIGLRVRRTRQKRGLTRRQLAERSKISLRYRPARGRQRQRVGGGAVEGGRFAGRVAGRVHPRVDGPGAARRAARTLVRRLSPRERQFAYELLLRNLGAAAERKRGVALVGLRGAGKSTLGKRLAAHHGVPFVRLGDVIAELASLDVAELFSLGGQTLYRRLEHPCPAARHRRPRAAGAGGRRQPR